MDNFAGSLNHWLWWTLAVLFIVLEIFTPGTFFLFLGIAAAVLGFIVLLLPGLGWEVQILGFALLAILITLLGRQYLRRKPLQSDLPTLNRRGARYIGRSFMLDEAIHNGQGKITIDDTLWKISGADCPAGTLVRVTAVTDMVLQVEAMADMPN